MTVAEAFSREKSALLALPATPFPVYERKQVHVGKTPYARFDLNDYSLPHAYANRNVVVEATLDTVSITDGPTVVATHARSFDKGRQIEDGQHIDGLWNAKKEAHKHRAIDRLRYVAPSSEQFFLRAAERGSNLGRLTQLLVRLLDLYGAAELEAALSENLARGNFHSAAVQSALERRRSAQGLAPPVPLQFSQRRIEKLSLVPKSLNKYNKLLNMEESK